MLGRGQMIRHAWIAGVLLLACGAEDAPPPCEYHGELYMDGEQFPAGDGCNTCVCNPDGQSPGEYSCSLLDCSEEARAPACNDEPPDRECPPD